MEITANALQAVAINDNILFTDVVVPSCNRSIVHRRDSGLVRLRGITHQQSRARFKVTFNGNLYIPTGGASGTATFAIAQDGEGLGEGTMSTYIISERYANVSATVLVDVPAGCCSTISVKNLSNQSISVQNANLIVERIA